MHLKLVQTLKGITYIFVYLHFAHKVFEIFWEDQTEIIS